MKNQTGSNLPIKLACKGAELSSLEELGDDGLGTCVGVSYQEGVSLGQPGDAEVIGVVGLGLHLLCVV